MAADKKWCADRDLSQAGDVAARRKKATEDDLLAATKKKTQWTAAQVPAGEGSALVNKKGELYRTKGSYYVVKFRGNELYFYNREVPTLIKRTVGGKAKRTGDEGEDESQPKKKAKKDSKSEDEETETKTKKPKKPNEKKGKGKTNKTEKKEPKKKEPKKFALVIGLNKYERKDCRKLTGCVNDAHSMDTELTKFGYACTTVKDDIENAADFTAKVGEFVATVTRGSKVMVFFAGHGEEKEGENHLIAQKAGALSVQQLIQNINAKKPSVTGIILDCCRSDGRGAIRTLKAMVAPKGTFIAFSCAPGMTAGEESKQGKYTTQLVKVLQKKNAGNLEIVHIIRETAAAMLKKHKDQQPWYNESIVAGGDAKLTLR